MSNVQLSIIIVTFNSSRFIKDCLKSIEQCCTSITYEIWISDNHSADDTLEIAKEFEGVNLIRNKENLGFAKANNLAVSQAKGEYILLLNHDTILLDNLQPLLDLADHQLNLGAIGIKMVDGKKEYALSVGKFPKPWQLIKLSSFREKRKEFLTGQFKHPEIPRQVDWLTGAFLLTRKEDYQKVGGLDESYFMYVEDVDYCKKLSISNKENLFLPSLSFVHFVGFDQTRENLLLKGFEIYAKKFFNRTEYKLAKTCLNVNYAFKKRVKGIR